VSSDTEKNDEDTRSCSIEAAPNRHAQHPSENDEGARNGAAGSTRFERERQAPFPRVAEQNSTKAIEMLARQNERQHEWILRCEGRLNRVLARQGGQDYDCRLPQPAQTVGELNELNREMPKGSSKYQAMVIFITRFYPNCKHYTVIIETFRSHSATTTSFINAATT